MSLAECADIEMEMETKQIGAAKPKVVVEYPTGEARCAAKEVEEVEARKWDDWKVSCSSSSSSSSNSSSSSSCCPAIQSRVVSCMCTNAQGPGSNRWRQQQQQQDRSSSSSCCCSSLGSQSTAIAAPAAPEPAATAGAAPPTREERQACKRFITGERDINPDTTTHAHRLQHEVLLLFSELKRQQWRHTGERETLAQTQPCLGRLQEALPPPRCHVPGLL
ncbi:hypothetical protein ACSSS7_000232 [Eimeria intestinalis]